MALYGLDLSDDQATDVVRQAKDFVILKATYGTGFVETDCDNKYQLAKSLGLKLGVYHVCYNRLNSAVDEANWFADNIQGYLGEAIPFVDNERWVSKANGALLNDPTDVAWQEAFNTQFYARTQVRDPEYMNANNTGLADWSPIAAHNALWCAGYPAKFDVASPPMPDPSGADMPYDTHAWPFATFWQYSSSAGALDRDIFYGTAEAWDKIALGDRQGAPPSISTSPAPSPPPNPPVTAPNEPTTSTTTTTTSTTSSTTTLPPGTDVIPPPSTLQPPPATLPKPPDPIEEELDTAGKFVLSHYNKAITAFLGTAFTYLLNRYHVQSALPALSAILTVLGVFHIPNTPKPK